MKGLAVSYTALLEGSAFAILAGLLLLAAVIFLVLRTRRLPVCWHCGYQDVRRSHSRHFLDEPARAGFLYPYRCEKCLRRFYAFNSKRIPAHRHRTASGGR